MSEKPLPFVVTDRRKFTTDGEARPDADPSPEREPRPETVAHTKPVEPISETPGAPSQTASPSEVGSTASESGIEPAEQNLPAAPTAEEMEQSRVAFQATAD